MARGWGARAAGSGARGSRRRARTRPMEGTALLWVRVDRGGQVLAYDVEESSGHRVLDRAVLRAVERADPLPPLPDSYPDDELEVVIPIAFRLRQ